MDTSGSTKSISRSTTRRENFSKKLIDGFELPAKRMSIYDAETGHLGLRIEPNGQRSFYWFRKIRGKPTFRAIGAYPDVTIEKARETAQEWNGALAEWKRHGFKDENPFEKPRKNISFGELVEDYIKRHVLSHAKRPDRAEKRVREQVELYLGDWKPRKLSEIRRADVLKLHDDLGEKHKYAANRTIQLIRLLFNFAIDAEMWRGTNPAARVKRFAEPERERFLSHQEVAQLFAALKKEPSRDLADFVKLALWTGARRSDIFSMRWADISFEDRRWLIPDPKKKPYAVPITQEAEEVLRARLKTKVASNIWVFPSRGKSGHVEDLKSRWQELLKRAKISNFRIHDLRRTQGSWAAAQGVPLQVIGKSLGHSSPASTKIYARLDIDPVRQAMASTNAALVAASKKKIKALPAASNG
jgi:integrase